MKFHTIACCLFFSIVLLGCTRQPETKSRPALPIASGEIIRAVLEEQVVPTNGMLTNYIIKARILNEGHVDIYDGGLVVITDPDGAKHGFSFHHFIELSYR